MLSTFLWDTIKQFAFSYLDKQTMKLHVIHFGLFIILAALDLFLVEVFTVSMTATDCLLSSFLFSFSTKKNIEYHCHIQ
jgi:hypothetical protein